MSKLAFAGSVIAASVSGVLSRPCCVLPVLLSTFGFSGAVASQFVATYRPVLLAVSIAMLAASLVITLRRDGGTVSKIITVSLSIAAFVVTQSWTGVF